MYAEDSFFALTQGGQIGLVFVSLVLSFFMLLVAWAVAKGRIWPIRILTAVILIWLFMWVSPQAYYAYYGLLFENLPRQWVIGSPPSLLQTVQVLTFTGPANLSHHGQGVLGLLMIAVALWQKRNASAV